MKKSISWILKKCSEDLSRISVETLTEDDVKNLNENSPVLIKKIKDNIKSDNPLKYFSDEDKILLLSFVVYKRQNIATAPTDDPNTEDAAKILHGKVYKISGNKEKDKEVHENIEKDLIKQLSKAGLSIKKK